MNGARFCYLQRGKVWLGRQRQTSRITQGRGRTGSRLTTAVIRDGYLWTCHHVGLDGTDGDYDGDETGASVDRSAAQWLKLQINASGDPLTYADHGRIFDSEANDAEYYYYPSLMVSTDQDMVVGFSGSRATSYIGAYYWWRRRADGATAERPVSIISGHEFTFPNLWGDYSSTTLDPVDDSIWTIQQYAKGLATNSPDYYVTFWGTRISKIIIQP